MKQKTIQILLTPTTQWKGDLHSVGFIIRRLKNAISLDVDGRKLEVGSFLTTAEAEQINAREQVEVTVQPHV